MKGLEEQLGTVPPPGLARLATAELRDLGTAIADARHRQAAELAAASDQALRHIPKLLRVPLRKVLG